MQINSERMINNLLNMIKIDSVSYSEKDMADWIENYFKERNAEVYRDNAGDNFGGNSGNILAYVKGTLEGEAICFATHMDTVEPGNGIKPIINGNYIESDLNTILAGDDKAGIASILEAYEYIRENNIPHRDLYFMFSVCEEVGMLGAKNFDCKRLNTKNIVVVDAAGPAGIIAYAAPAKDDIKVKFIGKKAHAGIEPEKGINAIYIAAEAISNMILGRIDEETTSNIGRIEGGGQTNIVTDEVTFTAEVRSHSMSKLDEQVSLIKEACKNAAKKFDGRVEFDIKRDYPNLKLDKNSFVFTHCVNAFEKEGIRPNAVIIGGGSDANILAGKGYDCAIISCGMEKVHTVEERLSIEDLQKTSSVILRMMVE